MCENKERGRGFSAIGRLIPPSLGPRSARRSARLLPASVENSPALAANRGRSPLFPEGNPCPAPLLCPPLLRCRSLPAFNSAQRKTLEIAPSTRFSAQIGHSLGNQTALRPR